LIHNRSILIFHKPISQYAQQAIPVLAGVKKKEFSSCDHSRSMQVSRW